MTAAVNVPPSWMGRWLPGVHMLLSYRAEWLPKDLVAGLILGAVMVPVGLAFGDLAGAPLAGLYAGIFPLIVYAIVGSSRQLIIGPDASMAAIVAVSVVIGRAIARVSIRDKPIAMPISATVPIPSTISAVSIAHC